MFSFTLKCQLVKTSCKNEECSELEVCSCTRISFYITLWFCWGMCITLCFGRNIDTLGFKQDSHEALFSAEKSLGKTIPVNKKYFFLFKQSNLKVFSVLKSACVNAPLGKLSPGKNLYCHILPHLFLLTNHNAARENLDIVREIDIVLLTQSKSKTQ